MWHHDVTNPRTCQFSAVCLTVFPFEFRPRTFTTGFYGKNSLISELMILECSFPLTSTELNMYNHITYTQRDTCAHTHTHRFTATINNIKKEKKKKEEERRQEPWLFNINWTEFSSFKYVCPKTKEKRNVCFSLV